MQAQTGSIWVVLLVRLCYLLSQADSACIHNFRMSFYTLKLNVFCTWADVSHTFQATFSAHWGGIFFPTKHIWAITHSQTLR